MAGNIYLPVVSKFDSKGIQQAESGISGLGSAVKKFAGLLAGAFAVGAIGNFAKEALSAAEGVQVANNRLDNITSSMGLFGDSAGAVSDRLKDFAGSQELVLGTDAELIKSGQAKLMTFSELAATADEAGGAFDRATLASVDLAAAGFGSVEGNAVALGKALQDPIKGITALGRMGVTFTDSQKEMIKAMVESGDVAGAQNLILKAVEQQVGGTAAATATASEKIALAFDNIKEEAGAVLLPVLEQLAPVLVDFAAQVGPVLAGAFEAVTPALTAIVELLPGLLQAFTPLIPVIGQLAGLFAEIIAGLMPPLISLIQILMPIITALSDVFIQIVSAAIMPLLPVVQMLIDAFMPLVPVIVSLVQFIGELVTAILPVLVTLFTGVADIVLLIIPYFIELLEGVIMPLIPAIMELVDAFLPFISQILEVVFDLIQQILPPFLQLVNAVVIPLIPLIVTLAQAFLPLLEVVLPLLMSIIETGVIPVLKFLADIITSVVVPIVTWLAGIFQNVLGMQIAILTGAFQGIATVMQDLAPVFEDVWNGIADFFKSVVNTLIGIAEGLANGVIDVVNSIIRAINSVKIDVPQWVTDLTGIKDFGFNLPTLSKIRLPRLAEGGLVMPKPGGVLAMIAEAGEPEVVIPLDRMGEFGGKSNINITINAGFGSDPVSIGRSVVDAIRRYENVSGRVFARA